MGPGHVTGRLLRWRRHPRNPADSPAGAAAPASGHVLGSAVLLLVAAISGQALPQLTALLLAAAMGAVNVSTPVRARLPGLTYMTGTLVKLGQALGGAIIGLATGSDRGGYRMLWTRYALLWLMITIGSLGASYLSAAGFGQPVDSCCRHACLGELGANPEQRASKGPDASPTAERIPTEIE